MVVRKKKSVPQTCILDALGAEYAEEQTLWGCGIDVSFRAVTPLNNDNTAPREGCKLHTAFLLALSVIQNTPWACETRKVKQANVKRQTTAHYCINTARSYTCVVSRSYETRPLDHAAGNLATRTIHR